MKKLSGFFLLFTFCVNLQAADPQATTPDGKEQEQQCPDTPAPLRRPMKAGSARLRAGHGRKISMDPAALQALMNGGDTTDTNERPGSTYGQRDREDNK